MNCCKYTGPCGKFVGHKCLNHANCTWCMDSGYHYVHLKVGVRFPRDYREICELCGGQSNAFTEETEHPHI